jgi:hypothetical protein
VIWLWYGAVYGRAAPAARFIYTDAPRYDGQATLKGGERFPSGATLQLVSNGRKRALVPRFAASADASVSFDGARVLFSGKAKAADRWQIWEIPVAGGTPRRVAAVAEDSITPFYLPGDRMAYSRKLAGVYQVMSVALDGGAPQQLTYGPGDHVATDVLRDGRILFEAPHAAGGGAVRELYTVYSDGSGVETYRCDHGRDRHAGRQLSSGDIVFETGGRAARFTSARAAEAAVTMPAGEIAGPVAETGGGEWLVSYRANAQAAFALYRWKPGQQVPEKVAEAAGQAVLPVALEPRPAPKWHPSALGDRDGANLLCLNVYTSRERIRAGSVAAVRVWALDEGGNAVAMGQAPVEPDGSFYVQPPGERPIRFELLDRAGKTAAAEKGWFWARRGEQRVCVGCHAGPERAPENAVPAVLLRTTDPVKLRLPVHGGTGESK